MTLDVTILDPGLFIGRSGRALEIRREGEVLESVPLHRLFSVTLGPGIALSSDILAALAERGVPVVVLTGQGRAASMAISPTPWAGAAVRRAQARAGEGAWLPLARALIRVKLIHQARLQRYWAHGTAAGIPRADLLDCAERIAALVPSLETVATRTDLMALEAQAARIHWRGVAAMIPFRERVYPRAEDLPNRLLNYAYGILARHWLHVTLLAGLDPNLGLLHADRPGRPSLVLDLMEPWRPLVDRIVTGLLRQKVPLRSEEDGLDGASRERLVAALHKWVHTVPQGYRWPLRTLWIRSTRLLAAALLQGTPWSPPKVYP